ncbi:poly(beta-D-mannuronate) lyase [Planctobacterium marinum]|uniref:Poly(Beta-D-mannuronate) lyase n=1 Tax=Planctobacterium marinum TaxID=1631968 RepID=A0AA48HVR6_9ALTE|nr:hypothetical protein MACH26_09760 [Planctobacterium marinum]
MNSKRFALCAIALALAGCGTGSDSDNNPNSRGSIALQGIAQTGETLTATVSDPDGISGAVSYIWYADGEIIEGASGASFTLTDAQIGLPITVQAFYTDNIGINESHISTATDDVAAIPFEGSVGIEGDALVGATLTATVSDDNGLENAVIAYQWYADDMMITDAVQASLLLTEQEFGKVISVQVNYTDDRGFTESLQSPATDVVSRVNTPGSVIIVGTPTVGNVLQVEVEDEDGASGDISYQWYANGEVIAGAESATYTVESAYVGQVLTVMVTYVDDNGFAEEILSEPTIEVANVAVDEAGSIAIIGEKPYLSSATLMAQISDNNGVDEANVSYIWFADEVEIEGANDKSFTPAEQAGAVISVMASYTDNDGFSDTVSATLDGVIFTQVVSDAIALTNAVNSGLSDSSVIGLNSNVYTELDEISLTTGVVLKAVEEQTPVITGEICIHVADGVSGAGIEGIAFSDIDIKPESTCATEQDAIIYSEGESFVFTQNTLSDDQSELNQSEMHWLMIAGNDALIERNSFSGRNHAEKGAVIKLASSGSGHVIQYNLFSNSSDNPNFDDSSLYLINLGSTTGSDSADMANFTVQYNRVENFVTGRRMMRVQTSGATIHGNTVVDVNGGISLEDGGFNTVTDNIIIRTTDIDSSNDRPSGVLMTPMGHTVENNYIAGIRSTNKEAGGIVFTANPFSQADGGVPNAGNQAILDGTGDLTLSVKNNTVLNSIQPIVFSTEIGSRAPVGDCDELTADNSPVLYGLTKNFFVIDFDANLIANGLNDDPLAQGLFLPFDASSSDHSFEYDCDLINHGESLFSNNFGFSDSYASGDVEDDYWVDIRNINGNGSFESDGAVDQDPAANGKEAPELVTADNTLTETDPNGAQAIAGAKGLYYITADQVGAGSTWMANDD